MNQNDDELVHTTRRVPRPQPQPRMIESPPFSVWKMIGRVVIVFVGMLLLMIGLMFVLDLVTVPAQAQSIEVPTRQMNAEDKVEVLKLMVRFSAGQVELGGMVRQMEMKARVVREQGRELERLVERLRDEYHAEGCLLDEDVEWVCKGKKVN